MTSIVDPPCFSRQARPLPPPLVIAPAPQQRLGDLATTIVDGDECRPAHALPVELIAQEDVMRCFFVCVCHELWPVFPCNAVYSSSRSPGSLLAERGAYSESTIRRVPSPRLDKPRPEGSCMRLESQRQLDAETALSISTRAGRPSISERTLYPAYMLSFSIGNRPRLRPLLPIQAALTLSSNWPGGVVVPHRCTGRHAALYTIGKTRSCGMALSLSIDPNRCPSAPDSSQVRGSLSDPPQRGPSRADEKVNDPCTINASDQRPAVRLTSVRDEADLLA